MVHVGEAITRRTPKNRNFTPLPPAQFIEGGIRADGFMAQILDEAEVLAHHRHGQERVNRADGLRSRRMYSLSAPMRLFDSVTS